MKAPVRSNQIDKYNPDHLRIIHAAARIKTSEYLQVNTSECSARKRAFASGKGPESRSECCGIQNLDGQYLQLRSAPRKLAGKSLGKKITGPLLPTFHPIFYELSIQNRISRKTTAKSRQNCSFAHSPASQEEGATHLNPPRDITDSKRRQHCHKRGNSNVVCGFALLHMREARFGRAKDARATL